MELRLVATPVLEVLCSCSYRLHLEEPLHMQLRPLPGFFGAGEMIQLTEYWRKEHKNRRRNERSKRDGAATQ
jgi:hypothetical protein